MLNKLIIIPLLFIHSINIAMNEEKKIIQKVIQYNEMIEKAFQEFALTRPYGKDKTYFDCLPKEVVEQYFKTPLAQIITRKFKHRLLKHSCANKSLKTTNIKAPSNMKPFYSHDGNYSYTPDIGYDFVAWNALKKNNSETVEDNTILLHNKHPESTLIVYCPTREYGQKNKNHNLTILYNENLQHHTFKSPMDTYISSYNNEWLIFTSSQKNNTLAFLNLNTNQKSESALNSPVTALCAAHHSALFAISLANGAILLTQPNSNFKCFEWIICSTKHPHLGPYPIINMAFSPDDAHFLCHTDYTLALYDASKNTVKYTYCHNSIRKACFSPDGQMIIIFSHDGEILFIDRFTGENLKHHDTQWRHKDLKYSDTQPPLILWAQNSNLLCTLDPTNHHLNALNSFVIRKANTGKFLYMHKFYPKNPIAMGLTKDENTLVFVLDDNSIALLDLYSEEDNSYIDFIKNKATLYQLCDLLQICKNDGYDGYKFKFPDNNQHDINATAFINAIKEQVKIYQNK